MILRAQWKEVNVLNNWATISFSTKTPLLCSMELFISLIFLGLDTHFHL
jgi:hypothetical protein